MTLLFISFFSCLGLLLFVMLFNLLLSSFLVPLRSFSFFVSTFTHFPLRSFLPIPPPPHFFLLFFPSYFSLLIFFLIPYCSLFCNVDSFSIASIG